MFKLVDVVHDVYSWDHINPQKTTHQIDRICGAHVDCAVASALSVLCVRGAHLLMAAEVRSCRHSGSHGFRLHAAPAQLSLSASRPIFHGAPAARHGGELLGGAGGDAHHASLLH